ncbi:serine/threonine-protein kinase, partial [Haliangium sp. UPWRP_2]|uniref:serine/threonine-protein kinase n=1 Tax=Haliangium sp. UPWRP_2 TaxID=1931276 RepID=UPI001304C685
MSAATPSAALPQYIGPYRIVRKLGEGGMGAVFEALHEAIERRVAIKVLHPAYAISPEFTVRFFNEARAVNRVDHPGLVQIFDYGQLPGGMAYIIMELLRGESLSWRMKHSGGALSLSETLNIGWQLADALAAAHNKQVVHRDLKPDNVMLVPDPHMATGERSKLLDFGIAKIAEAGGSSRQIRTRTNAIMGTPLYMSPEQCAGAGGVDAQSDVYSLGVMLYEMLSGRRLFVAEGAGYIMGMHMFQEPTPIRAVAPSVPLPVAELVHRMLYKEKAQRPSMLQVASTLASLFILAPAPARRSPGCSETSVQDSGSQPRGLPSTLGLVASQIKSRQRLPRFLLAGGIVALVLPGVSFLFPGRKQPTTSATASAG